MAQLHDSDKIKLYSQGAYGCIYKPGMTCKNKLDSKKFIRKIQKDSSSSKNEKLIGGIIKKIKHYRTYFAPVIESCPISINTIENEEIKKCEIINETSEHYVSNKIRYVGKNTLSDHLLYVYKTMPKLFLKLLFSYNIDILEEVSILNKNHIIHMDLKENNIIIDETLNKPILIDFGLSFQTTSLNDSNLHDYFFIYEHYSPWCFEINFINCILHVISTKQNNIDINTTPIQQNDLDSICNKFIIDNTFLQSNFKKEELELFKTSLISYVSIFNNKPLKSIIDDLMKYSNSWDNYAVAIIFISIIKENNLDAIGSKLFNDYLNLLKGIILSTPDKRPTCDINKESLLKLVKNVFKHEKQMIHGKITNNSMDDSFLTIQNKKSALHKLDNLTKQADIHKALDSI
jgi:serine/threonine protein kinase